MAIPVIMPRQGQSVESCIITAWKKHVGDAVQVGDILFTYETDKSTFEEAAKADGTLLAVFFAEDDDVPCLTNVAVIGTPGESFAEFAPDGAQPAQVQPVPETKSAEAASVAAPAAQTAQTAREHGGVSPRARAAAETLGVSAAQAMPSGPHGRVIERDVVALARESRMGAAPAAEPASKGPSVPADAAVTAIPVVAPDNAEYEDVRMPNLRRVIARTMHESLSQMAQLTHNTSFDATRILALREQIKSAPEEMALPKITINDMLLFAVSRVLMRHAALNAHCLGETVRYFKHVNLGIAVDTPRGLLVPTLFAAETKSLGRIALESKALAKAAQEGSINPDLLTGGTFTISNVGVYGIESFTPVINPPQVGLLGICCVTERVRTVEGQLTAYPAMGLSLTYDHRAVDGAPASRFLKDLVTALERFDLLMIG